MQPDETSSDPDWFRPPTRRERWIAGGLFTGFGAFFVVWFFIQRGWWFRWCILGLGMISLVHGIRNAIEGLRPRQS